MKSPAFPRRSFFATMGSLLAVAPLMLVAARARADQTTEDNAPQFTERVGYAPGGAQFSGTVSLRLDRAVIDGQARIVTTILSVIPEPGFTYAVLKGGGANGPVEIEFTSAACRSNFRFRCQPGLTRIDFGLMRPK
jgi:hypothetical protein